MKRPSLVAAAALSVLCATLFSAGAAAQTSSRAAGGLPEQRGIQLARDVGIEQRLGEALPADARFTDENGVDIALGDLFGERPFVLAFVYYECPMLCGEVLRGMLNCLEKVPFTPGEDYDVLCIGIDPGEGPALAKRKELAVLEAFGKPETEAGWHFLTGREEAIAATTEAAGFRYAYDAERDEFAHAAALMVVTPDGRLSRYFTDIHFSPLDMRLALTEAGEGGIGSLIDAMLLFCFHYDPTTGKYGVAIINVLRVAGGLTVLLIGAFILRMLRRDRVALRAAAVGGGSH